MRTFDRSVPVDKNLCGLAAPRMPVVEYVTDCVHFRKTFSSSASAFSHVHLSLELVTSIVYRMRSKNTCNGSVHSLWPWSLSIHCRLFSTQFNDAESPMSPGSGWMAERTYLYNSILNPCFSDASVLCWKLFDDVKCVFWNWLPQSSVLLSTLSAEGFMCFLVAKQEPGDKLQVNAAQRPHVVSW